MKSAIIHGALLVLMLGYGYRTWTADKAVTATSGNVVLWNKAVTEFTAIEFTSESPNSSRVTKLERRSDAGGSYVWGTEITTTKRPKPVAPVAPVVAAGSGSGAAVGSGAATVPPPPAPELETVVTTQQFPVGEAGDKLVAAVTKARALRDLGALTDSNKKDYKLDDSKTTFAIQFATERRTFVIGGAVFGGADRYAMEAGSQRGYLLSKDLLQAVDSGKISLQLADPRGFDNAKLYRVTVTAAGKFATRAKTVAKLTANAKGASASWGDPATNKVDETMANFVDKAATLRPSEYQPELKISDLTEVVNFSYADQKGSPLGTLTLYKRSRAAAPPVQSATVAGAALTTAVPPAAPTPTMITEYFIVTPKTRVPGLVATEAAKTTENDLATVFGQ